MALWSWEFKATCIERFVNAVLAYVQSKFNLREYLKPIIAKITLRLFFVCNSTVHLILNYIVYDLFDSINFN